MKKKKINLIVTLIVAMALIATTTVFASAATVKINKKSLSLYAGKTATVKVLNASKKVTWTSSKKTVATVKSIGKASAKITAKKAGTTTITGKIGKKKYTCKVTVKYATGSRQKPADPTKGVTMTDWSGGKLYFKLNNTYRKADAVQKLKEMGEWESAEYSYEDREPGTDLMLLEFSVKAISGFDESSLWGADLIGPSPVYNEKCNATIDDFDSVFLDKNDRLDLKLYDSGEGTMYYCAYVPDELKAFGFKLQAKSFKDYWVKYEI